MSSIYDAVKLLSDLRRKRKKRRSKGDQEELKKKYAEVQKTWRKTYNDVIKMKTR